MTVALKGGWSVGKQGPTPIPDCPYNCRGELLDEHGRCRHLIGYTNDGLTMEVRQSLGNEAMPDLERVGHQTGGKGKNTQLTFPVEEGDLVVATRGTSKRVYRRTGAAPYPIGEYTASGKQIEPIPADADQATAEVVRLRRELAAKQQEIADMQALLETQPAG